MISTNWNLFLLFSNKKETGFDCILNINVQSATLQRPSSGRTVRTGWHQFCDQLMHRFLFSYSPVKSYWVVPRPFPVSSRVQLWEKWLVRGDLEKEVASRDEILSWCRRLHTTQRKAVSVFTERQMEIQRDKTSSNVQHIHACVVEHLVFSIWIHLPTVSPSKDTKCFFLDLFCYKNCNYGRVSQWQWSHHRPLQVKGGSRRRPCGASTLPWSSRSTTASQTRCRSTSRFLQDNNDWVSHCAFSLHFNHLLVREEQGHPNMADSDCTWIGHSVLQPRLEPGPDEEENVSGETFWGRRVKRDDPRGRD